MNILLVTDLEYTIKTNVFLVLMAIGFDLELLVVIHSVIHS
jgi:hypothetical protein